MLLFFKLPLSRVYLRFEIHITFALDIGIVPQSLLHVWRQLVVHLSCYLTAGVSFSALGQHASSLTRSLDRSVTHHLGITGELSS